MAEDDCDYFRSYMSTYNPADWMPAQPEPEIVYPEPETECVNEVECQIMSCSEYYGGESHLDDCTIEECRTTCTYEVLSCNIEFRDIDGYYVYYDECSASDYQYEVYCAQEEHTCVLTDCMGYPVQEDEDPTCWREQCEESYCYDKWCGVHQWTDNEWITTTHDCEDFVEDPFGQYMAEREAEREAGNYDYDVPETYNPGNSFESYGETYYERNETYGQNQDQMAINEVVSQFQEFPEAA